MSGIYAVLGDLGGGARDLAGALCAQVCSGTETLCSYASDGQVLLGIGTHDFLDQGAMPVFEGPSGLWVLMEGRLYEDGAARARAILGQEALSTDMALFASLHSRGLLEKALPEMNGAFFVMLWDPVERVLVACNDRFGLYPNYWADNGRLFCLGGRILCPVLAKAAPGAWNPAGVAQLLTTGDYSGDETPLEGVSCFPQASIMTKRPGLAPSFRRYWSYDYRPRGEGLPPRDLAAMMGEALVASVRNQSRSDHRVGVTLSGGLDSRCLAVALAGLGEPVRTTRISQPMAAFASL